MPTTTEVVPLQYYKPSELLSIFKNFLSNKEINASVLCMNGIYWKAERVYGNVAYDKLRDENTPEEITIVIPISLRDELKNGNLVSVYGTLDRRLNNNGSIQFLLNVTRVEKVKELAISEDEVKRAEFRRLKGEKGYKNVDNILEERLFNDKRPKVALIYAGSSITDADFEKGLDAAKSHIDFIENRVSFANPTAFCELLKRLESEIFDVIAIVRGGGSGIEKLDDITIVEALAKLNTAWIYGVGHEKENLFIQNLADKCIPIPFAVGTYFRDMVERVMQKRNNSRAVLVKEVHKQYQKQIEDSNKKNAELTKQLETLQKQHKESSEASNKQIAALTKAQIEAQAQSKKQIDDAAKLNTDLQGQLKAQGKTLDEFKAQQKTQQESFAKSLGEMQKANNSLQESLTKLTAQNTQANKELSDLKGKNVELEKRLQEGRNNTPVILYLIIVVLAAILCFMLLNK